MEEVSFLKDISDSVHCPVCLELFSDPQALPCLHSLCPECISKLVRNDTIVCPTCRKITATGSIMSDFKTKQLVEIFQKQGGCTVAKPRTRCRTRHKQCILCEDKLAEFYCNKCERNLCEICCKSHVKLSECEASDTQVIEEQEEEEKDVWDICKEELLSEVSTLRKISQNTIDTVSTQAGERLEELDLAEDETVKKVRRWYVSQRRVGVKARDEACGSISTRCDELIASAEQVIERINLEKDKQRAARKKSMNTLLQKQVDLEMDRLRRESFQQLKLQVLNKDNYLESFDESKAIKIKVEVNEPTPCSSATVASTPTLPSELSLASAMYNLDIPFGQAKTLQNSSLTVQKLADMSGSVNQLMIVSGQLWALMNDGIQVLSRDGSVWQRLMFRPGVAGARDMCVSASGHIIVAILDSGLHQLTSTGTFLRDVDKGRYWSVARDEHGCVWALKEKQEGKVCITKFKISSTKCEQLTRYCPKLSSNGCMMYCIVIGQYMYICSHGFSCVYEIDLMNGHLLSKYGQLGRETPGQLDGPLTIYKDTCTASLLVTDCVNHRLQLFDPILRDWTLVKTIGSPLVYPTAVAADSDGKFWVTGGDWTNGPYHLYMCTL